MQVSTGSCSLKPSAMATCGTARARSLEAACQFILLPRPIREREGVVGTAGAQRAIAADAPSRAWLVGARAGPAPDTYGCSPTNKLSLRGGWLVPDHLHFPERNVVLVLAFLQLCDRRPHSAMSLLSPWMMAAPRRRRQKRLREWFQNKSGIKCLFTSFPVQYPKKRNKLLLRIRFRFRFVVRCRPHALHT